MALINCPECGKEISDSNTKCPHCGFKLNFRKEKINKQNKIAIGIIIALGIIAISLIVSTQIIKLTETETKEVAQLNKKISKEISAKIAANDKEKLKKSIGECKSIKSQYSKLSWKQKIKIKKYSTINKRMKTAENDLESIQKASIDKVTKLINGIGDISLESENKIAEAESAYLALDEDEKKQIKNYDDFNSAKNTFGVMKCSYIIDSIGEVTLDNDSGDKIDAAWAIYNGLSDSARQEVKNFSILKNKQKTYNTLSGRIEDLKDAVRAMKEGNLNEAQRLLKKLPDDVSYKSYKALNLKKKLNQNSDWVKICGRWSSTSGQMKVNQVNKEYGNTSGWTGKINKGDVDFEIRCKLSDDGTVKVMIDGAVPIFTEYSSISIGLERGNHSIDVSKKVTQMGSIKIDKYTTVKLSTSGITVSYYNLSKNEDVYFDYTYSTNMNLNKRKEKY